MKRLVIVGAGGHGRAIAEIVQSVGAFALVGFFDDAVNGEILGSAKVIGRTDSLHEIAMHAEVGFVAIGNNRLRERLCQQLDAAGLMQATIVHPRAVLAPSAILGAGCALMAGSIVGTEAVLGRGVIVNSGAVVDHHCVVEDFGHVGTGVAMAGGSVLARRAWMQAGSSLGYRARLDMDEVLRPGESRSTAN